MSKQPKTTACIGVILVLVLLPCTAGPLIAQDSSLLRTPASPVQRPGSGGGSGTRVPPVIAQNPGGSGTRAVPALPLPSPTGPGGLGSGGVGLGDQGSANQGSGSRQPNVQGSGSRGPSSAASPLSLQQVNWTQQAPVPVRRIQKNDLVTIRVDEIGRVIAAGSAESRKRSLFEAALTDWIRLTNFRLRPDPQGNGDPTIGTESNNNHRAEATVETRESLTFNIAAKVVDIRPNGLLLLEAGKRYRVNDNLWETSVTGLCRAQDIAPDNVVLSKDMIDLDVRKFDRGRLRDGYSRGWFQRWFDRTQPF